MLDVKKLNDLLNDGDAEKIAEFMQVNGLELRGTEIHSKNPELINEKIEYWDKRQLVKKINLNS